MQRTRTLVQLLFRIFIRPIFPALQWLGRVTGVAREAKTVEGPHRRQPYLIGHLAPGESAESVRVRLLTQGFELHPIAYPDPGQVLSMRRLHDTHPDQQFHLRVFEDGEVKGHLEYTPEDRPLAHMDETLFEEHNSEFRAWLGETVRAVP